MAKEVTIKSPIKVITSGKEPTTENLANGEIGVGKVDGRKALYANMNGTVDNVLEYDTKEADATATVQALGGIPAGTKASDLKGKPVSEILDTLIFPVVQPTYTNPSATISLKSTATTPTLQEVGATGASVPTAESFNYSFNRGAINIAGTKKQDRAGAETSHKFQCNGSDTLPTTLATRGQYKYKAIVSYAAGPQPLDSKGNETGTPLAAGSVNSNEVVINVEYPYFANTAAADTLTKMALTTNKYIEPQCVAETSAGRHSFALPAIFTVGKIEYFDTVANAYKPMSVSDFTATEYNETVQGKQVAYKKYVRNTVGLSGATKFKVTFAQLIM